MEARLKIAHLYDSPSGILMSFWVMVGGNVHTLIPAVPKFTRYVSMPKGFNGCSAVFFVMYEEILG
jgi:hypothetical protein